MMRANITGHASRLSALALASALAAIALIGCSSAVNPPAGSTTTTTTSSLASTTTIPTSTTSVQAAPTNTSGPSTYVPVEIGNTVWYLSTGQTETISCENGKSLNVVGSNNTLTVNGTCEAVSVGGTGNKITIDKVNLGISAQGFNNTITYKDGDPKVDDISSSNTIRRGS